MARAATETQQAGLSGLEFGLAIPGTVGGAVWANAGAHERRRRRRPRVGAGPRGATAPRPIVPAAELGLAYRDSRFKHAPPARRPSRADVVVEATFRLTPADPDDDQGAPRRHPPLAPGPPAARAALGRQRLPQPGRRLGRAAHRRRRAEGPRGSAARSCPRSTPTSSSTTRRGRAADVRRLAEHVRAEVLARYGVDLAFEVEFVGDWSGWEAAA